MLSRTAEVSTLGGPKPRAEPRGPVLAVHHAAVRYDSMGDGELACSELTFELEAREKLTVLGPTGCGKSTLLKAIAGYLPLAAGEIMVDDKSITGPGQDRFVMFQEFDQLFPWQTIQANVEYAIRARGRKSGRRITKQQRHDDAEVLLASVGLAGRGDIYPNACSGGMKQRVALARALAVEPKVLLLDEPFGALDAQTRDRLQLELLEMCALAEVAILFVTHDIGEAVLVGDRVMMMDTSGHILEIVDTRGLGRPGEQVERTAAAVARLRYLLHAGPVGATGSGVEQEV